MAEQKNPYAAPSAPVDDVHSAQDRGEFVRDGQSVPSGYGWKWWQRGFAIFWASPWMWMLVILVLAGLFVVAGAMLGLLAFAMMRSSPAGVFAVAGLFGLTLGLAYPILEGGLMLGARAVEEGEGLGVGHLFAGFGASAGRLLLVGLFLLVGNLVLQAVVMLLMGAGLAAGLTNPATMVLHGALLSLIYLALTLPFVMAFWFAPALVTFHDMSAFEALRSSFLACLKNGVPFLIYGLAGVGLAIAIGLAAGIVTFITRGFGIILLFLVGLAVWPIFIASIYASYRDIYTKH